MVKIKIYIRATEPWSHTLQQYLKSRKISYSTVDVSVDQAAFQEMVRKSGQKRVPVAEIDDQIVVGFDRKRLDELLEDDLQ